MITLGFIIIGIGMSIHFMRNGEMKGCFLFVLLIVLLLLGLLGMFFTFLLNGGGAGI